MAFTRHGHRIPRSRFFENQPEIIRCGGIHVCNECATDCVSWMMDQESGVTTDTRWTNVFASVYTCVIDETQWEFTLDYWDGDEFYSQVTRVSKQEIIENPKWFGMLWNGMVARLDKHINKENS